MAAYKKAPFQMSQFERAQEIAARLARQVLIRAWRDAAVADGWTITPTYGERESIDSACTLIRDGFQAHLLTRAASERMPMPEASICVWCPAEISLDHAVPFPYDWAALVAGTRHCPQCGATDVATVRVMFASRACEACAPGLAARICVGNWTG